MWSLPPSAALTGGATIKGTAGPVNLPSNGEDKTGPARKRLTSFLKLELSLLPIRDQANAGPAPGLEG